MKNHLKLPLILLVCFVMSSCAALRPADMSKISIGMDKPTVIATLGKSPEIVGAKMYGDSRVEVFQYAKGFSQDGKIEYYWLFFYNGKLSQYGRPSNWERTADDIAYAQRH